MSKRDYGDSSISQRKDGTWTARIYLGRAENGKQKIKGLYGKTEAEVKKKLKEFKNDITNISKTNLKTVTLEEYINNWLYTYRKNELKSSSFDRLESTIKHHIIPNLGFLQLKNITSDDIQKLINDLFENNLSHSTIKKVHDALNACFKFALVRDDVLKNPVTGVKMLSVNQFNKKEIIYFSKEQREKFKTEALRIYKTNKSVYNYGQAFILMLNTGIRESEMCGIHKQDIDLENNILHIRRNVVIVKDRDSKDVSKINGYKKKLQDTTKTYSGNRVIPLNKTAKIAIESLIKTSNHKSLLLATQNGEIISPDYLSKTFKKILLGAQLPTCGTHTLRHTFASVLFERGIEVKLVSELLGHADVSVTYNTYIHLIKKQKAKAVETLDDI